MLRLVKVIGVAFGSAENLKLQAFCVWKELPPFNSVTNWKKVFRLVEYAQMCMYVIF